MGLPPLEHIECYLDSPLFREIIAVYERELEENAVQVKSLVNECRQMIQATEGWWTDDGWQVEALGRGGLADERESERERERERGGGGGGGGRE